MNNLLVGFIGIVVVLAVSLEGDLSSYLQIHSMVIVGGGTLAILIFSTPQTVLKSLWVGIKDLFRREPTMSQYRDDILQLSVNRSKAPTSSHPLISYAQELWSQGLDPDLFIVLVSQKKKELDSKKSDGVQALKNLAKYPPTLGMTGTVIGMIKLFGALDENKSNIGQALSIAMTATFFGLILANVLISPLADRLHVRQVSQHRLLESMYELLILINQGEPSSLIKEELNDRAA